jgi:hypothetical protein
MRLFIAAVAVWIAIPAAEAKTARSECRNRCDSTYQFCLNRATTKQAKKSCKSDRGRCKNVCK